MTKALNDNDQTTFFPLAAATARVVLKLNEKQNEETDRKPDTSDAGGQRTTQSAADIERRVRDILAMENRLRRKMN